MPRTYKRVRARYSPSWPCQRKNNRIIKRFSHHRTRALNKGANEVTIVASEKATKRRRNYRDLVYGNTTRNRLDIYDFLANTRAGN